MTGLELVDQLAVANINTRTYNITVAWNIPGVKIVTEAINIFPKVDDISDEFTCKRSEAIIEDEEGIFFGAVNKTTNLPDGYGVFATDKWVHCGEVRNGHYTLGRKVSVSKIL